jgi:hypothetical protein
MKIPLFILFFFLSVNVQRNDMIIDRGLILQIETHIRLIIVEKRERERERERNGKEMFNR